MSENIVSNIPDGISSPPVTIPSPSPTSANDSQELALTKFYFPPLELVFPLPSPDSKVLDEQPPIPIKQLKTSHSRHWTEEEDELVRAVVSTCDTKWDEVGEGMTASACKERRSFLKKTVPPSEIPPDPIVSNILQHVPRIRKRSRDWSPESSIPRPHPTNPARLPWTEAEKDALHALDSRPTSGKFSWDRVASEFMGGGKRTAENLEAYWYTHLKAKPGLIALEYDEIHAMDGRAASTPVAQTSFETKVFFQFTPRPPRPKAPQDVMPTSFRAVSEAYSNKGSLASNRREDFSMTTTDAKCQVMFATLPTRIDLIRRGRHQLPHQRLGFGVTRKTGN